MTSRDHDASDVSSGGSRIIRHSEATPFEGPSGEESTAQISDHIERHLGKVDKVFHELVSDTVHIDVHQVKPTSEFPFWRLVTSGMSDLPMTVPENTEGVPRFLELMITLPGRWRVDQEAFKDENWYWPVRLLKSLARLPHTYKTWLGWGHTIPNGDPAEAYARDTKLAGSIILPPVSVPSEFSTLRINESKEITFLAVVPLYPEEMDLKLRAGSEALLQKFDKAGVGDVVDPVRKNVAKKRFGLF